MPDSYLVDTNVWLERLLNQAKAQEVGDFLASIPAARLAITDFSFHSIAIVMARLSRFKDFLRFQDDLFLEPGVTILRLASKEDMGAIYNAMNKYNLDFDDAYQYQAARSNGMALVSFDGDFDRTDISRKYPIDIIGKPQGFDFGSPTAHEAPAVYKAGLARARPRDGVDDVPQRARPKAGRAKPKRRKRK